MLVKTGSDSSGFCFLVARKWRAKIILGDFIGMLFKFLDRRVVALAIFCKYVDICADVSTRNLKFIKFRKSTTSLTWLLLGNG